jgi:hypothetical protein
MSGPPAPPPTSRSSRARRLHSALGLPSGEAKGRGCPERRGIDAYFAGTIRATNVSILDNTLSGIENTRGVQGANLTLSGNGHGADAALISHGGGSGITANRVRVDGFVAENNAGCGVFAGAAVIKNGSLSGNDGYGQGLDLVTARPPRLGEATTCGKSAQYDPVSGSPGSTWGAMPTRSP